MKVPEDAQLKKPPEEDTVQKHDTIESTEPIVSIPVSIPGPHIILTKEEQKIKIEAEHSKGIDPCEEGMECNQDKENRRKEPIGNSEENLIEEEELKWRHEDLIPEADGPTITPDKNGNPGGPQDQKQDKETEETKEAQSKPYDPEEALRQRPKEAGQNSMDVVRTLRLLKDREDQEMPAWQVAQQQRVRRCMENQAEKDETRTWQEKQQHKIRKCMEAQT